MITEYKKYKNTLNLKFQFPIKGWTEGLDYHKGYLWLSLPKTIRKYSIYGELLETHPHPTKYGESICWIGDDIYALSYVNNCIYKGHYEDDKLVFNKWSKTIEKHGWGVCYTGVFLVCTGSYSNKLYYFNPNDGKLVHTLETELDSIEDLCYDGIYFWTSSFRKSKGSIFVISPITGKILNEFVLPVEPFIIDGIALNKNNLWLCGKRSNFIYCFDRPMI